MKLQDLPNEILDYILMKVVVKEVMEKKLAKSAWIDYAVRVIKPLRMVSSHWENRLTTNWFKVVLSRNIMLKGKPQNILLCNALSSLALNLSREFFNMYFNTEC